MDMRRLEALDGKVLRQGQRRARMSANTPLAFRGRFSHRGTSLIRNHTTLGPCSTPMPRALWWSWVGWRFPLRGASPDGHEDVGGADWGGVEGVGEGDRITGAPESLSRPLLHSAAGLFRAWDEALGQLGLDEPASG